MHGAYIIMMNEYMMLKINVFHHSIYQCLPIKIIWIVFEKICQFAEKKNLLKTGFTSTQKKSFFLCKSDWGAKIFYDMVSNYVSVFLIWFQDPILKMSRVNHEKVLNSNHVIFRIEWEIIHIR